jgi:arylsulfatase A-like enzyme
MLISDGIRGRGAGMHVSLSPYDMHNTLVATGPDFREGLASELPSGNLDIAPTVLQILGLNPAEPMDGRVLWEALRASRPTADAAAPQTNRIESGRDFEKARWRQYLQTTRYDGVTYLDEGGATADRN